MYKKREPEGRIVQSDMNTRQTTGVSLSLPSGLFSISLPLTWHIRALYRSRMNNTRLVSQYVGFTYVAFSSLPQASKPEDCCSYVLSWWWHMVRDLTAKGL